MTWEWVASTHVRVLFLTFLALWKLCVAAPFLGEDASLIAEDRFSQRKEDLDDHPIDTSEF